MFNFSTNFKFVRIIDILINFFLFLGIVFLPIFLDKNLSNYYALSKQYLFFGVVLVCFLLWAVKSIFLKKVVYCRTFIDLPLLLLFVLNFLSAIFSVNIYDSFLGRTDYFVYNFVFIVFSLILYYLIINQVKGPKLWRLFLDALLVVGGITSLYFLFKVIFSINFPFFPNVLNTIDGTSSIFGIWIIFNLILAATFIMKKTLSWSKTLLYFFLVLLHFVVILLIGFSVLWWFTLAALLLILLLGILFLNQVRMGWLSVLFTLIIITSIFVFFGAPKKIQAPLPPEISLSSSASWSIAKDVIFSGPKNFLIGSGLGTFVSDFSKYKDNGFNYNSVAWSLRFNQPGNTLMALLSEGGVLVFLNFVFIFLLVLGFGAQAFYNLKKENFLKILSLESANLDVVLEVFALLIGWVILSISLSFCLFGVLVWWLWWLVLAFLIVGLNFLDKRGLIIEKSLVIEETPQYSLVFSFMVIVLVALTIMLSVLGVRFYLAEHNYVKALNSNSLPVAEGYLNKAILQRANADIYHVALARVYLMEAGEEAKNEKADTNKVAELIARAVNEAKQATGLSPKSVALWENLATMYENAAVLVPEARNWAQKSLEEAILLEPNNPVLYLHLGNIYLQANDSDKALEQYKKSLEIKSDYVDAYVALANVYEIKKDLNKAIENYSIIMPVANQNPQVLFNLGRLLYNRKDKGDWDLAEKLWLETLRLQPDYSNALYSLGLLYEVRGDNASALEYYYKVKDLNPDNNLIQNKINSLIGAGN
ncbi:MAG: TPR Domain containing protein [Candidatus Magasanikbacteria bacterium GW2011_GWC2_37_14]|uniref:TPR Domain containing protein n=1 Tax=Candidatus Magasanikbacteria bacterium GW2011_GWC2_37_14 TaxID=1619046 RepID=A0A0G0ITI8_9BACT|nr:MAG: TPR Domain containing protein [Candidatus Magasanikbacteria bacterium GW2011_GWC2_37_14]